ncbi:MAG: PD-(D/E)XK nuclease family protein [Aureispira sp.]
MILQFGLDLEERCSPKEITIPEAVQQAVGVNGLMAYLEKHLGMRNPDRQDYLRFEQYRQILRVHAQRYPDAFYTASFEADEIATASALLQRRDELFLSGWNFFYEEALPVRLKTLAQIEALVQSGDPVILNDGFAERYERVLKALQDFPLPLEKIYLNEPLELLPPHLQYLFSALEQVGVVVEERPITPTVQEGDLQNLQNALLKKPYNKRQIQADGSLIIIKAKRETYAAEYWAKVFKNNPTYRPVCIIPNKNRALDNSLIQEGLPSLGIASESIARPTLQILKLVSTFLWKPIDPYKILEFVSLPNTPIHKRLSRGIAKTMAQKPGLFSGSWNAMVGQFFGDYEEEIAERSGAEKEQLQTEKDKIQEAYRFWFNRRRYDTTQAVPKSEVVELYRYVANWAQQQEEDNKKIIDNLQKSINRPSTPHDEVKKQKRYKEDLQNALPALEALRIQSGNLVQVLEALPEQDRALPFLRLERLVRTINEPAAVRFRAEELGHLPYVHQASAIVRSVPQVFWWNFVHAERETGFARWYPKEREYLAAQGLILETPAQENARFLWQRMQPMLQAQERLVLVMPQYIEGNEQLPHPLWGDLCAALGEDELAAITVDLDQNPTSTFLAQWYDLPQFLSLPAAPLSKPKPYFQLPKGNHVQQAERESFSSIDSLLYYPYQWVFRYQIKFSRAAMLSVVNERRLEGNIAHRLLEGLFTEIKESGTHWAKQEVQDWIDDRAQDLLEREGAVLLMYGQEAKRIGLIYKVQQAAWALVLTIQNNGWQIYGIEHPIAGVVANRPLTGIADLVLEKKEGKEKAIVDLKWGGKTFHKDKIKNGEDLQLVIYSKLLDGEEWAHTAYFIIESATLLARNRLAFDNAEIITPADEQFQATHERIWNSIEKTYEWRMQQVEQGQIEVRTKDTLEEIQQLELEQIDNAMAMVLLEMKREDARYDDYQVLIHRVQ